MKYAIYYAVKGSAEKKIIVTAKNEAKAWLMVVAYEYSFGNIADRMIAIVPESDTINSSDIIARAYWLTGEVDQFIFRDGEVAIC